MVACITATPKIPFTTLRTVVTVVLAKFSPFFPANLIKILVAAFPTEVE